MSIVQVAREGLYFVVQVDGASIGQRYETRGKAILAALKHKEEQS